MDLPRGELVLTLPADEKEWLAARRTGIGASEIAAAANLSLRRGPWDVWDAKVNGREFESTDQMRWGTHIEGAIISWWARETGRTVGAGGLYRHPEHRWLIASPDAVVLTAYDEGFTPGDTRPPRAGVRTTATVDAKNAGHYTQQEWSEDGAPIDYLAQITHQMVAVGVAEGFLVAAVGGQPPIERCVGLDEEFAGMLIAAGAELWEHVQDGTPPPVDGSRSARKYLARRYPTADPDALVALTDADVAALRERVAIDAQIANLKEVKEALENRIKEKLGSAIAGTFNGKHYCTWKNVERAGYTVQPGIHRQFRIPAAAQKEMGGHGERE
jgi:putative phage-type endonuclease